MLKVSEIISKDIISVYEGQTIGTIKNITFNHNLTKVDKFILFHDEAEATSCIEKNNIYALSEDGLMVKNISKIDFFSETENNPLNKKIYSISAVDYGKISDIFLDEKCNVIKIVTTKQKEFLPTDILKFGDYVCIINDKESKVKISSFKPKTKFSTPTILENIQVKIFNMEENQEQEVQPPPLPQRITTDLQNLIGKKVSKTILGRNNELIIKQYGVISKQTIEKAKIHNKTKDLIFNTI